MRRATWSPPEAATPGQLIRSWRRWRGLSQGALGELLGKKQATVSEYEADLKLPPEDTQAELAKASRGALPVTIWAGMTRAAARLPREVPPAPSSPPEADDVDARILDACDHPGDA